MADQDNKLKIGDPIIKFIKHIPEAFPEIREFNFLVYQPSAGVEARLDQHTKPKDQLFGQHKWDFERQLIQQVDENKSQDQIKKMLAHDTGEPARLQKVKPDTVPTWLNQTLASIPPTEGISIASKCVTANGEIRHIPLMDFACPPTTVYEQFIVDALQHIGYKKGILVRSGKSFHFYGLELITGEQWQQFISYAILLSPFTDVRYIGHRLISGYSLLRIEKTQIKPVTPTIVRLLNP